MLYVLFEIPSNIILKKLKPHIWLPSCMLLFGILTVCQGLVSSIGGLYVVRLFLGLAEVSFFIFRLRRYLAEYHVGRHVPWL